MIRTSQARAVVAAAFFAAVSLFATRAAAHAIGLSNGEYVARATTLRVKLTFARGELAGVVPALDANRDGHVTALEVREARAALEAKVLGAIRVEVAGAGCAPLLGDAALAEQDAVVVEGTFACPAAGDMEVDVALLDDLAPGHRHIARAIGTSTHDEVLSRGHAGFRISPAPEGASPSPRVDSGAPPASRGAVTRGAGAFFRMGVEHILTGYDHLAFLLALVLLRASVRALFAIVTAFTVGHSISLAVATFGILVPSARLVEPAIALSIAYVGIENFFLHDGSKRWRVTFPFGLVHGFGFAGALREVGLARAEIPTALVSFNLGVEAGQIAVMAVMLPLVFSLRDKQPWFDPRCVRVVSGAVAVAGGVWFLARVLA